MSDAHFGSDAMVDQLVDIGVRLVPFAPGATFRGIHDSLVNHRDDAPEIIECLHEETSVAVAHGYAKASREPTAVLLHDVVGLQHATMAIYNAWCDRVPLLLIGGSGPADAAQRRPWIDWVHTANVQGTQVRDYTKWDDQPGSLAATLQSLVRARQLAHSVPQGPVYVAVDTTIQEQGWDGAPAVYRSASAPTMTAPSPDPDATRQLADALVAAERPMIAVESIGRDQRTMDLLQSLADMLGAPVTEMQRDYNRSELCIATDHPLNVSGMDLPSQPDCVLALDVKDVDMLGLPDSVPVMQVSTAGLAPKAWAADLQQVQRANIVIPASVPAILAALTPEIMRRLNDDSDQRSARQKRAAQIAAYTTRVRDGWRTTAQDDSALTPALLAARLDASTRHLPRTLTNGSLHNWVHRIWSLTAVEQYLGSSGGAGLGYGLGASIGAALAYRGTDRLAIDVQSDGDALMSPQALWTAAHHQAPLLIVVENNRMWGNSYMHAGRIARARGRPTESAHIGTTIDEPAVDFTGLAESMGIEHTAAVSEVAELDAALAAARDYVMEQRRPALVDVLTQPESMAVPDAKRGDGAGAVDA